MRELIEEEIRKRAYELWKVAEQYKLYIFGTKQRRNC
jgi:hypothetical protein